VQGLTQVGDLYSFKIEVFNSIGSAVSMPTQIKLAAVPDKPTVAPSQDFSKTSSDRIYV